MSLRDEARRMIALHSGEEVAEQVLALLFQSLPWEVRVEWWNGEEPTLLGHGNLIELHGTGQVLISIPGLGEDT